MTKRPNLFIVGAPKSATTAMYSYLSKHPQIYMSPVKEPYYFGQDLVYHNYQRPTEQDYLNLFEQATDELVLGEASITYLVSTNAAKEIKAFNPSACILIMLRNPVDMMYSMHSQALFTKVETVEDFAEALGLEEVRKRGEQIPDTTTILSFILYRELASYGTQVKRYLDVFDPSQIFVIIYDDFVKDTEFFYRQTLQFLGVDDTIKPDAFQRVNQNKRRRNEWFSNILRHPIVKTSVRTLIPSYELRQSIAEKISPLTIVHEKRQPLAPELRMTLQKELYLEVEALSQLLDRDLTYWCRA